MQIVKLEKRQLYNQKSSFYSLLAFALSCWLIPQLSWGQEGNDDLDQAFDQKIKASSTRDLEAVVKLCKSAIEKGLDEESEMQAKQLAASSSMEHAEQLAKRIFDQTPPDPRWQKFRSEAIRKLKQTTEFQPDYVQAHLLTARLNLLPNGSLDAARAAIELAVEHAGDDRAQLSQALYLRATLSEDNEAKLADISQALKINPENLDALKFRAVLNFNNKETEKGLEDIDQWLSREDSKPQDFLETIALLRAMGPSFDDKLQKEALKIIERGLKIAPEDIRFLEQRAEIHLIRKETDKSISDLTSLIEMDSVEAKAKRLNYRLLRGNILTDQEKYDDALSDYDAILDENPKALDVKLFRGRLFEKQERFDEALRDYDAILKENPNVLEVIQARGAILAAQGNFAGSIKAFKKFERLIGSSPGLQRQIAMLYNANDEPSKSLEIYNELLEEFSEEKFEKKSEEQKKRAELERLSTWRSRGDAYLSLGKHKEAIEDYSHSLEIHQSNKEFAKQNSDEEIPEDDHVLNNLAWVLATSPIDELRDGKRAVELATRAAEATAHKEAHILSTLASAYAETGDFENAIKWIDKAIEVNAEDRAKKEDERNLEQKDTLQKEKEHYLRQEPFRELQNVEEEKAAKEKEGSQESPNKDSKDDEEDGEKADNPKAEKSSGEDKEKSDSSSGKDKQEESK